MFWDLDHRTAAMEPTLDALANPVGMGGVGPGAVTMGITAKDLEEEDEEKERGSSGEEGEGEN